MTATITEYGVRRTHPVTGAARIQWPATTGYLALPGGTVNGTDLEGLRDTLAREPKLEGASIVVRSYDINEVAPLEPALPTTPGSVVRGTDQAEEHTSVWFLTDDDDTHPWRSAHGIWSGQDSLTNVEILFDAGSAP